MDELRADCAAQRADGVTPVIARLCRLVHEQVGERREVAALQRLANSAELRRAFADQVRDRPTAHGDAREVEAKQLRGLEDRFLRMLPHREAPAEFLHRWREPLTLEQRGRFAPESIAFGELR